MADSLASVFEVVCGMVIRHNARFHNLIRRLRYFCDIVYELTSNSTRRGSTFTLILQSFIKKKIRILRCRIVENFAANFSILNLFYRYDQSINFTHGRMSAQGIRAFELSVVSLGRPLYIYEKRWTRTRDDRYQPLGGFTTNGEPGRVLDAIIRRAQDWWADVLARTLSARTWNAPPRRFYLFPPIVARHLSAANARSCRLVFQFCHAWMKYCEFSFD